jgi:hypothetical protein
LTIPDFELVTEQKHILTGRRSTNFMPIQRGTYSPNRNIAP